MKVLRTIAEVRAARIAVPARATLALVPTMGAFHDGHIALFRAARRDCDFAWASLFVNPIQFDNQADLAAYPRDEAADIRIGEQVGLDRVFIPDVTELYRPGHATWIDVEGAARGLEGDFRPGHFRGVATVCLKLFTCVRPHVAFFGQKDAQQVAVVRQIVRDLNLEVDIRVVPTVRDPDGLALSSRNARLSPAERRRALAIPRALEIGLAAYQSGHNPAEAARASLEGLDVDYVEVADMDGRPTLLIAARVGTTRLIDNVPLTAPTSS
jgi:pantoate--beta-alanine ligase